MKQVTSNLNKEEARATRWLKRALDRTIESLAHIHIGEKYMVACDGTRAHYTPTPYNLSLAGCTNKAVDIKVAANGGPAQIEIIENANLKLAFPTEKPIAELYLNARCLREALDGLDEQWVCITIYEKGKPLVINGRRGETPYCVLMMPAWMDPSAAGSDLQKLLHWRPEQSEEKEG